MFFQIHESYAGSHRIFVPAYTDPDTMQVLKDESMWGGHDKAETFDGILCLGFEIRTEKIGDVMGKIMSLEYGV